VRGVDVLPDEALFAEPTVKKHKASDVSEKGILIVGVDKLLTQLAGCCKPAPPDPIVGFVTRGKGVSVHRVDCSNFANMEAMNPERVIETEWGSQAEGVFAVDIVVDANDRQGLLRDVSEVFTREKLNVIAVSTQSKGGSAHMKFTTEISNIGQLGRTLGQLHEVEGVVGARRA
jgi:GTP pyrophosphokinase